MALATVSIASLPPESLLPAHKHGATEPLFFSPFLNKESESWCFVRMHIFPERTSLDGLGSELFKLVSYGASREQWAEWLRVPLEHAASRGNLSLVERLLRAGADAGAGWRGCRGRTLLDAAALGGNADVMSALIRGGAGADVNKVTVSSRRSALYTATCCGRDAAAKRLILAGADVNFRDPVQSAAF